MQLLLITYGPTCATGLTTAFVSPACPFFFFLRLTEFAAGRTMSCENKKNPTNSATRSFGFDREKSIGRVRSCLYTYLFQQAGGCGHGPSRLRDRRTPNF